MRFWTILSLIVVLSAVGLTYEIAAGRVLAPFFGTSLLSWTAVIATVLAGFSLGSALGGLVAERERGAAIRIVRRALVGTAVLMALSPAALALVYALGARGTAGMVVAVALAFFPASVLVSFPSPLLANMAVESRPGREGSSLGLVLAAGSVGAIAGAIVAGFVALPLIGSAATFAGCGAIALACIPLLRDRPSGGGEDRAAADAGATVNRSAGGSRSDADRGATREAVPAAARTAAQGSGAGNAGRPPDKTGDPGALASTWPAALIVAGSMASGSVCQYESGLSCIDVLRVGSAVHLTSDRTVQAAERLRDDPPPDSTAAEPVLAYVQWLWSRMDRDLGPTATVLFIGGGGYTLPARWLASRPEAEAVAVEIDPLVTAVVRRHLPGASAIIEAEGYDALQEPTGAAAPDGRLGIAHDDGRVFVNETTRQFDAVVMDAFSSGSVPAHLATLETYARLREISSGPVYVNLLDRPGGRLAQGIAAILGQLYPHVEAVQGPVSANGRANILFAASPTPLAGTVSLPAGYREVRVSPGQLFTDDRGWVGHR